MSLFVSLSPSAVSQSNPSPHQVKSCLGFDAQRNQIHLPLVIQEASQPAKQISMQIMGIQHVGGSCWLPYLNPDQLKGSNIPTTILKL